MIGGYLHVVDYEEGVGDFDEKSRAGEIGADALTQAA